MSDAFGSLELFRAFDGPTHGENDTYTDVDAINGETNGQLDSREELRLLREENRKLKSRLKLYHRFGHLFPSQTPMVEVDYFRSPLSLECQARIEAELYTLLSENRDSADENASDSDPFGQVLYLPYYILDSVGRYWENTPVQYGDDIPKFTQLFNVALDDTKDKLDMFGAKLPSDNIISGGPECFNCSGPHRISDCKQPRDKKRIAEKLKEFKESRGGPNHNDRYHVRVEKEIEDRFKEFVPGTVSSSLRSALGLEPHDLPPHIYRMRNFGYPPAYSIDPPLANSQGLVMYYKGPGSREDGELEDTPLAAVIPYPGYTHPPDPDVIDTFRTRNLPYSSVTPTLSDKRKYNRDEHYKRRRIDHTLGDDDMEVDQDEPPAAPPTGAQPPVPKGAPPAAPPPPPGVETETNNTETANEENTEANPGTTPTDVSTPPDTVDVNPAPAAVDPPTTNESPDKPPAGTTGYTVSKAVTVVSETNKIGIKFDQVEDYGPLDERAGNFTKLQCILRSRKKTTSKTRTRASARTKTAKK